MSYTLESLLNTTTGMEAIRNNKKNDSGTDAITGVDWFTYAGNTVSTIYVNGNNWIGFGASAEHLKICRRDGATYYVYRQEGELDTGRKFLKIRVEGYTHYSSTANAYGLAYEVFLFDDGCMFIELIQTPTSSSYLGTSSITDGTNTETLDVKTGINYASPLEITVKNAGVIQEVEYERYPPITPVSMTVSAAKTEYYLGMSMDKSTITVTCADASGNTKEIKNYTVSGFDGNTLGEQTVTFSYKNVSASVAMTVLEDTVSSISSVSMKTRYILGEPLEVRSIRITRMSGKSETVTSGYEVSGFDPQTGGDQTVSISYESVSTEKTVHVSETAALSVEDPKTVYLQGIDSFQEPYVKITYDNGEWEYQSAEFSGFDNTASGTCVITVSARGISTTYEVTVTDTLTANIGASTDTDIVASLNVTTGVLTVTGTGETKEITSGYYGSGGLFDDGGDSCQYAKEAVFGEGITGIYGVCRDMYNLEKVTLPESLHTIGAETFYSCNSLKDIRIPESVASIGDMSFYGCENATATILNRNCSIYSDEYAIQVNTIKGYAGSTAQTYAESYGITFEMIDVIVSIEITSLPWQTEYFVLASGINTNGMQVSGTTQDGQTVEISGYEVGKVDLSSAGEKTVTISYKDVSAQFQITVRNPSFSEILGTTEGMTAGTKGSAPWFMFDGAAAETVVCNRGYISFNGGSNAIKIVGGTSSYTSSNTAYVMETILDNGTRVLKFRERFYTRNATGYYVDHETFFLSTGDIYIKITHMPFWNATDSNYQTKGTLTSNSKTYNMGLKSETATQKVFYHQDSSGLDWTMKTEDYGFEATPQKVVLSIGKTDYFVGDSFSTEGTSVTLLYSDGKTEASSGYTVSEPDMSTAGVKQVTATDTETGITSDPVYIYVNISENIGYPTESDVKAVTDLKNGTLSISGNGSTKDYAALAQEAVYPPYYSVRNYIKTIEISRQITRLGSCLLISLGNAESISSLSNVTEIGQYALYGCSGISSELSLDSIQKIGSNAFSGSGFTKINVGAGIQEIGESAFSNCSSLSEVHIEKYEGKIEGAPWGAGKVTWIADLSGIEITTMPEKTEYIIGETLDISGLVVSEVYSDGHKEVIADGYTIGVFDSSSSGEIPVTVSYKEFTAAFHVTVRAKPVGIVISKNPDKTVYQTGEALDVSGMEIRMIRADGSEETISDYTLDGFDSTSQGSKTVTVSYIEKTGETEKTYTATFSVKITGSGEDPFADTEKTNIKVTVHWPKGEFKDLTNEDISGVVELKESLCSERFFIWGGCNSSQISFVTHSKQFMSTEENAYPHGDIEVYVENNGTKIRIFTGTIDSGERESNLTRRKIIAYDYLYKLRNTDIIWWYKNITADKNTTVTQKQFRDMLFSYLGIEQVNTVLMYDNAIVPDTALTNELNVVTALKDLCLQNEVFGRMNRDGKFEYVKLNPNSRLYSFDMSGNYHYKYYDADIKYDMYKSCTFKEGRIWYPRQFLADPYPGVLSTGGLTAQEAYDSNIYYNRNSFFIGNQDWMDKVFKADEYGEYTLDEPTVPICYGPNTELNDQKLFRAQQYNLVVPGNPLNEVGSTIEITVKKEAEDGTELTWNIHSYIMMRTLKIKGDGCIEDTYSANNSPYNSNNRNIGTNTQEISATAVRTRQEAPTISYDDALSDGTIEAYSLDSGSTSVNKAKLRCMKRMSKEEYDAMVEAGTTRTDTIYCTWEEL